jgi:hypothetical protein
MQKIEYKREYSSSPNIVFGFHGCNRECAEKVIGVNSTEYLKPSENKWDWLGHGIYFWESSPQRAIQWAIDTKKQEPAVIGAIIDLGNCLNLLDSKCLADVKKGYEFYLKMIKEKNEKPAINKGKLRNLDCAVINTTCFLRDRVYSRNSDSLPFDTIRSVFWEDEPLYENAGFNEKNHIQICVRNPNVILGYFDPLKIKDNHLDNNESKSSKTT